MGKGIREMAMSPEPEEKKPSSNGYHAYPSNYDDDYPPRGGFNKTRYDGNYDGSKYKEPEYEEERKDLIEIKLNVTYKELGTNYISDEGYVLNSDEAEFKVKQIAYDRLVLLLGKGFESKWELSKIEPSDYYECFEVEITLTPIKDKI